MKLYKFSLITFLFFSVTLFGQTKKKTHFGMSFGFGINDYKISESNWVQPPINYNDSLNSINSKSSIGVNLGISYYINFKNRFSLRPTLVLAIPETGKLIYNRKTGSETLDLTTLSESISLPFIYKFTTNGFKPYLSVGPSFVFLLGQSADTKDQMEFKTFDLSGQIGIGGEIVFKHFKIKPEVQYSVGFLDMRKSKNNLYNNTIDKLQRRSLTLTFYVCDLYD